jgi:hypothetical protein
MTRSFIRHAHALAREVGAKAVLLYADVVDDDDDVRDLIQDVDFRVILVTRRLHFEKPNGWDDLCEVVHVPDIKMTRAGQIKIAVLMAAAQGHIMPGERVVCTTGIDGSGRIDTLLVMELGSEIELLARSAADPLPDDVNPSVFERLLCLAGELGLEGREGHPIGALFVLGDCENVLAQSRQLVINPFFGYPDTDCNLLDPRLEETIKEFSAIDGAFIIRGDGVVLSAGRFLTPAVRDHDPLVHGLGTRHEAAAAITSSTNALAFCISQSTGTISIYRGGRLMTDIQKPRSRIGDGF